MPKSNTKWETFVTDKITIKLPDTFMGGHPTLDRKRLKNEVKELPDDIRNIFKNFFAQRNFVFMAADKGFNPEMNSLTCLVVIPEKPPIFKPRGTIEHYIQTVQKNLGRTFDTLEEDYFDFNGIPAARLLTQQHPPKTRKNPEPEVTRKHLMYAYRMRRNFWAFDFIGDVSVFDTFIPIFDEAIKSLTFHENVK